MKDPGVCRAMNLCPFHRWGVRGPGTAGAHVSRNPGLTTGTATPSKVDGDPEGSPQEGSVSSLCPLPCLPGHRPWLEKDGPRPGTRRPVKWTQRLRGSRKVRGPGAAGQPPGWEPQASWAWMPSDPEPRGARGNRGHQVNPKLRKLIISLV